MRRLVGTLYLQALTEIESFRGYPKIDGRNYVLKLKEDFHEEWKVHGEYFTETAGKFIIQFLL